MQRNSEAVNVHDRTARTTTTCGSVGLVVARVEIAVTLSVLGGVSVKTTDEAGQDTELLSGIVTDDSDLNTDCRGVSGDPL